MPTCCIPNCRSGYTSETEDHSTISFHRFPLKEPLKSIWLKNIHRRDFTPTSNTRVCSLHFSDDDYKQQTTDTNQRRRKRRTMGALQRKTLKDDAYPHIFPGLPSYLSETVTRRSDPATQSKRIRIEHERHEELVSAAEAEEKISALSDVVEKFSRSANVPSNFVLYPSNSEDYRLFTRLSDSPNPKIVSAVKVNSNLTFTVFHCDRQLKQSEYSSVMQDSVRISYYSDFLNLLAYVNSMDLIPDDSNALLKIAIDNIDTFIACNDNHDYSDEQIAKLKFIREQLVLVDKNSKLRRYSVDLLVNCLLIYSTSSAAYRFLLNSKILSLPSVRTLHRLTQHFKVDSVNEMKRYLQKRRASVSEVDAVVSLVFDEIYINKLIDYADGKFLGLSEDGKSPASSVLCFMINSVASKYCDVVRLIPLSGLTIDKLDKYFHDTMKLVQEAGFNVIITISDNHPVNRTFLCTVYLMEIFPIL